MNRLYSKPGRPKSKPGSPKPKRPVGYPLFAHASGQWAKKVRGRLHYFGTWNDPKAALEKWLAEKDHLLAGRVAPRHDPAALQVGDLCNIFLESRERRVETGELTKGTLVDYIAVAKVVVRTLGRTTPVEFLAPSDFAKLRSGLAKGQNLKSLEGHVARVRAIFNHAEKNGLIERSVAKLWGSEFNKPSKTALMKLKSQTVRLFAASEIWQLLKVANAPVAAQIWLGINGGLGPTDLAKMEFSQIENGWLNIPRSKTGRIRRIPLWPETQEALNAAIKQRGLPKNPTLEQAVFITKYGSSWLTKGTLSKEFSKLREIAGVKGKGKSFYSLRHTFQTIGDETRDFVAVSAIMGHAAASISDHYRERISDERLNAVASHVRSWLLAGHSGFAEHS